jgi:hypothetical protein
MPDKNGLLTSDEKERIAKRIESMWTGSARNCPICGSNQWLVGDHLVQPVTLGPNNSLMLSGPGYPQVMLISTCGHTLFFNAVILGVLPAQQEGTPAPPSGGSDVKS